MVTIKEKMEAMRNQSTGFDYLRIILSFSVLVLHSIWYSGQTDAALRLIHGRFSWVELLVLPMFFALSGFLVSGSLLRNRLHQFITLRVIRIMPALAVEVLLSSLILGTLLTEMPIWTYLSDPEFHIYLLNIIGIIHFKLPGLFQNNPGGPWVNPQLWTIPYELYCYEALVAASLLTLIGRRAVFSAIVAAVCVGLVIAALAGALPDGTEFDAMGRRMVLGFLAAVSIYLYRDRLPYSNAAGLVCILLSIGLYETDDFKPLASFPIAYVVVWLGLMRPRPIPFGDLSYGVYLFHLPIQQTIVSQFADIRSWWLLSLTSLPVSLLFAYASWSFVEKPILQRKQQILAFTDRVAARLGARWKAGRSQLARGTRDGAGNGRR